MSFQRDSPDIRCRVGPETHPDTIFTTVSRARMATIKLGSVMKMARQARQASQKRVARGMTLIEFLGFVILVVCVIAGAALGRDIIESWYGCLLGGILGALVFVVCLMAIAVAFDIWFGGGLPNCRNGCCRGPSRLGGYGDYDIQESGEEFYRVCKCGERYKRCGNRFILVNEDGTETPYLIWRRFKGWVPAADNGSESDRKKVSG